MMAASFGAAAARASHFYRSMPEAEITFRRHAAGLDFSAAFSDFDCFFAMSSYMAPPPRRADGTLRLATAQ